MKNTISNSGLQIDMPKAILKRRLNFMTSLSDKKERICDIPKGIHVHVLRVDGKQVQILFKSFTKWVHQNYLK